VSLHSGNSKFILKRLHRGAGKKGGTHGSALRRVRQMALERVTLKSQGPVASSDLSSLRGLDGSCCSSGLNVFLHNPGAAD
jgi:hypothetical protein